MFLVLSELRNRLGKTTKEKVKRSMERQSWETGLGGVWKVCSLSRCLHNGLWGSGCLDAKVVKIQRHNEKNSILISVFICSSHCGNMVFSTASSIF